MKKIVSIVLAFCLCLGTLTGCGKKVPADEYVMALYNLIIVGDSTKAKEVGVSDDEIKEFSSKLEDAVDEEKNQLNKIFESNCGTSVDSDLLDEYMDAYFAALKNLSATAEISSEDGDKAEVVVKSTYIDMTSLVKDASTSAKEEIDVNTYTDQNKYMVDVLTAYVKDLIKGLKEYKPSDDTNEVTLKIVKSGKTWNCQDDKEFSNDITSLIAK